MGPNPYRDVVERARVRLQTGDDLEAVLVDMRASGMSEISCIKAVRNLLDVELGDAKAMVHFSEAFADRREANEKLHESLVGALTEINEVESRTYDQAAESADPTRELGDLRAALTITLRMARRRPGPDGLTILSVPTDGEILGEIRRLRELADNADAQHGSTAADPSEPTHDGPEHRF